MQGENLVERIQHVDREAATERLRGWGRITPCCGRTAHHPLEAEEEEEEPPMNAVVEMTPEPRRNRAVAVTSNVDIVQAAAAIPEMYREAVALFKDLEGMAARKAI